MQRGIRRLTLGGFSALALAGLLAAVAIAATTATVPASSVRTTSAKLNALIDTGGAPVAWQFQYGTSTNYNKGTPVQQIAAGQGTVPVSWELVKLEPNTTYHFRAAVTTGNGTSYSPLKTIFGRDLTFTTRPIGKLVLLSRDLTVKNGFVYARLACRSRLACDGKFSITTRARLAKTRKFATIDCTQARTTSFKIDKGKDKTVRAGVTNACLELLKAAGPRHRIGAKFSSRPRTGQLGIITNVLLFLR